MRFVLVQLTSFVFIVGCALNTEKVDRFGINMGEKPAKSEAVEVTPDVYELQSLRMKGKVKVVGSVVNEIEITHADGLTINQAILYAGELQICAKKRRTTVKRLIDGKVHYGRLPLDSALKVGDIVSIPCTYF